MPYEATVGYKNSKLKSSVSSDQIIEFIKPNDLKEFGLIPEILGRLPVISYLKDLNFETLRRILVEPKNALTKQYVKLFKYDDIDIVFKSDALDFIVNKALEYKLGARGLRSICESILVDYMFESPGSGIKKITIDKNYVDSKLSHSQFLSIKKAS